MSLLDELVEQHVTAEVMKEKVRLKEFLMERVGKNHVREQLELVTGDPDEHLDLKDMLATFIGAGMALVTLVYIGVFSWGMIF